MSQSNAGDGEARMRERKERNATYSCPEYADEKKEIRLEKCLPSSVIACNDQLTEKLLEVSAVSLAVSSV